MQYAISNKFCVEELVNHFTFCFLRFALESEAF